MGKKSSPPPDYTPVANASKEATEISAQLGREQMAEARRQYDESMAVLKPITQKQVELYDRAAADAEANTALSRQVAEKQMGVMDQTMAMAKEADDYNKSTFRPIERTIVDKATEFNTDAAKDSFARRAAADVGTAAALQKEQNARAMASMGVRPGSGRFAAIQRSADIMTAAQAAGASTNARERAEALGDAKLMDAAGLGRNLPGISQGAYGLATGAGSAAVGAGAAGAAGTAGLIGAGNGVGGAQFAAGGQYMAGLQSGGQMQMGGRQIAMSGLSNILNNQTSVYNNSKGESFGSVLGGLGGLATGVAKIWPSDRRLKVGIVLVGRDEHTGLSLYEFAYKWAPDLRVRGVMADEVLALYPHAVTRHADGYMRVNYGLLGLEMKGA